MRRCRSRCGIVGSRAIIIVILLRVSTMNWLYFVNFIVIVVVKKRMQFIIMVVIYFVVIVCIIVFDFGELLKSNSILDFIIFSTIWMIINKCISFLPNFSFFDRNISIIAINLCFYQDYYPIYFILFTIITMSFVSTYMLRSYRSYFPYLFNYLILLLHCFPFQLWLTSRPLCYIFI